MSDVLQNRDILAIIALNTKDIASLCKLATVSRLFYKVFTSDEVWGRFNVYDLKSEIFRHFVESSTQTDFEFHSKILVYEAPFHWYTRYQQNWYAIVDVYANNRDFPEISDKKVLCKVLKVTNASVNIDPAVLNAIVHPDRNLCLEYYSRGKPSLRTCPKEFRRDRAFVYQLIESLDQDSSVEYCDCGDSEEADEVPEIPLEHLEHSLAFDIELLQLFVKKSSFLKFVVRASATPHLSKQLETLSVPQSLKDTAICYRPRQHLCAFNSSPSGFFGDPQVELRFQSANNMEMIFETPRTHRDNGPNRPYIIKMDKFYNALGSSLSPHELHKAKICDFGWVVWNNPGLLVHFDWVTDLKDLGHLALVALQRNKKSSVNLVPAYLFDDYDFAMMAIWYNQYVLDHFEFGDPRLLEIQHLYREQNLLGIGEIFSDYLADSRCGVFDEENACKYWGRLTNYPRYYINVHCCDKILPSWLGELPDDLGFDFDSDSDLGSDPYSAYSD